MKIVVLDGYTLNPGDLSWDDLRALGECDIYDRTALEETVARSQGTDILLTNKTVLDADIIAQLPDLKYVGVLATGYNVVDVKATTARGIPVTNVPEYSTQSVVQMVFAHILNHYNHVAEHSTGVHGGKWCRSEDFAYWDYPLFELLGKTLGIVGFGKIGSSVADVALAFGMNVLAYNPSERSDVPEGVIMTDLDSVFEKSDIVTLHCPLTDKSKGFVNAKMLGTMKSSAFLVNTSRGPVIDEQALADALNEGRIAGAGLDVLCKEPADPDCPLLKASNCYVTPHIAWATYGARLRLINVATDNIKAFLDGENVNVVNG